MITYQVRAKLLGMRSDGQPKAYEYLLQAPDADAAMTQAEDSLDGLAADIEVYPL